MNRVVPIDSWKEIKQTIIANRMKLLFNPVYAKMKMSHVPIMIPICPPTKTVRLLKNPTEKLDKKAAKKPVKPRMKLFVFMERAKVMPFLLRIVKMLVEKMVTILIPDIWKATARPIQIHVARLNSGSTIKVLNEIFFPPVTD